MYCISDCEEPDQQQHVNLYSQIQGILKYVELYYTTSCYVPFIQCNIKQQFLSGGQHGSLKIVSLFTGLSVNNFNLFFPILSFTFSHPFLYFVTSLRFFVSAIFLSVHLSFYPLPHLPWLVISPSSLSSCLLVSFLFYLSSFPYILFSPSFILSILFSPSFIFSVLFSPSSPSCSLPPPSSPS